MGRLVESLPILFKFITAGRASNRGTIYMPAELRCTRAVQKMLQRGAYAASKVQLFKILNI
jgi:hypothetical protein